MISVGAVVAGRPGWHGQLPEWTGEERHTYLSTACRHGLHEQCGQKQQQRGDTSTPHCKFCAARCVCPVCRHPGAPVPVPARAVYPRPASRGRPARWLHIVREDGPRPGREAMCGHRTDHPVILDPMPASPPHGLMWCPACVGQLAEQAGLLDLVVTMLL